MKKEQIKITELSLWDENPRFPEEYFSKNETELIDFLFTKKGEKEKLLELAKSIINNFDIIPWERLIVYRVKNKNIVLEGNRRLVVYKLLLNPELTTIQKVQDFFKKVNLKINNDFKIECLTTGEKEEGLKYLELKHLEAGYKGWGEPERNNFKRRRGNKNEKLIIRTKIDTLVKDLDLPQELKDSILGHGVVTTFYRVVAENTAMEHFGYKIEDEVFKIKNISDFKKRLKVIIWDLLNKQDKNGNKLNSRTLNKKSDIKKYLVSVKVDDYKRVDKEIKEATKKDRNLFGDEQKTINIGTRSGIKVNRKTPRTQKVLSELFGGSLFLRKSDTNGIYRDIIDLYTYYLNNQNSLSQSFPSLIRMALRLLVESATSEKQNIQNYVNINFDTAKKKLTQDQKTTLANNAINGKKSLMRLLQSGAHNYTNSANFEQTIAMSIIIGAMLKITHNKK